jgi:tetratricopeptide (TPR) repeat protein
MRRKAIIGMLAATAGILHGQPSRSSDSRAAYEQVVALDPTNVEALSALGALAMRRDGMLLIAPEVNGRTHWDEATEWYRKLAAVHPDDKLIWGKLGAIAWMQSNNAILMARFQSALRTNQEGPLPPKRAVILRTKYGAIIDQGIADLGRALELDANFADAIGYLSMLFRERADLAATREDFERDLGVSTMWQEFEADANRSATPQDHIIPRPLELSDRTHMRQPNPPPIAVRNPPTLVR